MDLKLFSIGTLRSMKDDLIQHSDYEKAKIILDEMDRRIRLESHVCGERCSPLYCEHANEMPVVCPCPSDCYCKIHGNCK
jgi:hypothetical protein